MVCCQQTCRRRLRGRGWGLCRRVLSKNPPGRCPVLAADGNLRGEEATKSPFSGEARWPTKKNTRNGNANATTSGTAFLRALISSTSSPDKQNDGFRPRVDNRHNSRNRTIRWTQVILPSVLENLSVMIVCLAASKRLHRSATPTRYHSRSPRERDASAVLL